MGQQQRFLSVTWLCTVATVLGSKRYYWGHRRCGGRAILSGVSGALRTWQPYLEVRAVEELVEARQFVHVHAVVGEQELADLPVHVLL